MTILHIIVLGIVQGLTEFLPVSSSAHLVFVQTYLGVPDAIALPLDVFLHLGTLAAAAWLFRAELGALLRAALGVMRPSKVDVYERRLFFAVVLATIPAAAAGMIFNDMIERAFGSPTASATFLIVTGVVLLSTRFAPRGTHTVTLPNAVAIGLAQAVAILPGISRSGSTISTAIWLGVDRQQAARFSFLMSIPIIFGAALVEVPHLWHASTALPAGHTLVMGFLASFLFGILAIRVVLRVVGRGRFELFGLYCVAVGALVLFLNRA
jgi:undecaprenyl-diphosphatase